MRKSNRVLWEELSCISSFLLEMKQEYSPVQKCRWSTLTAKPVKFCVKAAKLLRSSHSKFKKWYYVLRVYRLETEQIYQKGSWKDDYKSLLSIQIVSELYIQELNKFNFSFILLEKELSSLNRMIVHHCMFCCLLRFEGVWRQGKFTHANWD